MHTVGTGAYRLFKRGENGRGSGTAAYDSEKEYTLSIGCYGDLEKAYQAVFATEEFKSAFPNLTIEFQTADFGGHHSRLTTVLAAGEATNDIEALEVGFIAKFVEGGGLTDLAAEPFNGNEVGKDIVEFAMSNATTPKRCSGGHARGYSARPYFSIGRVWWMPRGYL